MSQENEEYHEPKNDSEIENQTIVPPPVTV